jgi:DnaJ-class molecular chaperone
MGSFENPSKSTTSSNKLQWSLSQLELDINTDLNLIKKKYKELVKLHHPDVKDNSKKNIDKFRNLVEAYNYLLERYKK